MADPLLEARKVVKRYVMGGSTVTAVDGVSLAVAEGELTALLGRSGSGKSTLLHLLGGLDRPTDGAILSRGRRLDELSDDELALYRRGTVGFIFQQFQLVPGETAVRNVELPLVLSEVPRAERRARAAKLLDEVGLGARRDHRPGELSGGEQQRVCIARALANDPPLLLCDEPTGNLDTRTAREIMDLLRSLNARGRTILLVTHDRGLASEFCRRTVELSDGRILSDSAGSAA